MASYGAMRVSSFSVVGSNCCSEIDRGCWRDNGRAGQVRCFVSSDEGLWLQRNWRITHADTLFNVRANAGSLKSMTLIGISSCPADNLKQVPGIEGWRIAGSGFNVNGNPFHILPKTLYRKCSPLSSRNVGPVAEISPSSRSQLRCRRVHRVRQTQLSSESNSQQRFRTYAAPESLKVSTLGQNERQADQPMNVGMGLNGTSAANEISQEVQKRDGTEVEGFSAGSMMVQGVSRSLPPEGFILFVACIVGLMTGGAVVLFNVLVHDIHDFLWEDIPGVEFLRAQPLEDTWQRLILVPVSGGVVVGILNSLRSSLENSSAAADRGEPSMLSNVRVVAGPTLKALAAAVTLGTGNSLGPEGPSVEVGASIGTGVSKLLKNSRERTQAMIATGSAAGISSGFNAAVAGCFFAVESVLKKSGGEAGSLTTAMILLSSVLASVVSQAGLGSDPAFKVPAYEFRSPAELPLYLLLGVLCGLVSITLSRGSVIASQGFDRLQRISGVPSPLLPPLGSLCVGFLALAYPEILYWGFDNIDFLLESRPFVHAPPPFLLLQLVGVKIVATAVSRGSGLVGGVYAPSLFIGAALGSAYGRLAAYALAWAEPTYHITWISLASPQAYALVGMAATLAGVCQVPLTAVLLLFELTRDYRIILPLMAAVGLSSWIASTDTRKQRKQLAASSSPVQMVAPSASPISQLNSETTASLSVSASRARERLQPVVSAASDKSTATVASGSVQNGGVKTAMPDPQGALSTPADSSVNGSVDRLCLVEDSLCLVDGVVLEDELMDEIPVKVAMRSNFASVPDTATVRDAMVEMSGKREWCCLVIGRDSTLHGLFTLADVQQEAQRMAGSARGSVQLLPVMAVCRAKTDEKSKGTQIVTVGDEEMLSQAQRLMTPRGIRQLPVIDSQRNVLGLLDREGISLACRAEATLRLLSVDCKSASDTLLEAERNGAAC